MTPRPVRAGCESARLSVCARRDRRARASCVSGERRHRAPRCAGRALHAPLLPPRTRKSTSSTPAWVDTTMIGSTYADRRPASTSHRSACGRRRRARTWLVEQLNRVHDGRHRRLRERQLARAAGLHGVHECWRRHQAGARMQACTRWQEQLRRRCGLAPRRRRGMRTHVARVDRHDDGRRPGGAGVVHELCGCHCRFAWATAGVLYAHGKKCAGQRCRA